MCEDKYYNPAVIEYSEGFNNWQFETIHYALLHYANYNRKMSDNEVANAISAVTGIEISHDFVLRLRWLKYTKKPAGDWNQPDLKKLQAVVSLLLHPDIGVLKRQYLETGQNSYDIPMELSRFFTQFIGNSSFKIGSSPYKKREAQYNELYATYKSSITTNQKEISLTLIFHLPENGEFIVVREDIDDISSGNNNLSVIELIKQGKRRSFNGWGLIMPEGYTFFLVQDSLYGYNQVIITSNELDYYNFCTVPQKFFAIVKDEEVNFCEPVNSSDYSAFCKILGKALTFIKQD